MGQGQVFILDDFTLRLQDSLEKFSEETVVRKFREPIREENRNQLIVFNGYRYAIYYAY